MKPETMNLNALLSKGTTPPQSRYGHYKSKQVSRTSRPFLFFARKNVLLLILGLLFLAGLFSGAIFVSQAGEESRKTLEVILSGFLEQRQTQAFTGIFASTFFSIFVLLIVLFFCGFCTIAQIIILLLPLFKGLGYGFSVGSLYMQYGFHAVGYVSIMLLPVMLLSTILLICAAKTSFILSLRLLQTTMTESEQNGRFAAKRYCVKFAAYTLLAIAIAAMDAILVWQFGTVILP